VGIDQDDAALDSAAVTLRLGQQTRTETGTRVILLKGNYADLDDLLTEAGIPYADGFLFDLGVSSPQLDLPERGFSYHADAPLDMRMDPEGNPLTAAQVVNEYSKEDLTRILREYGEERWASRIAEFIVAARGRRALETTGDLVEVVKSAVPAAARRAGGHPARRTFQAIRIEVNAELEGVEKGIRAAIRWATSGGRIAVISYHSLEDRIVKSVFGELASGCVCPPDLPVCQCGHVPVVRIVTRKPVVPTEEEIAANPRARSARLRVAERA